MASVVQNMTGHDYEVLVTVDEDCPQDFIAFFESMDWIVDKGSFQNKVQAINSGNIADLEWDILINLSDDQRFTQRGFDDIIRKEFDRRDLFLHIPDGNRIDFSTMSIMDRDYYERDGFVYDPRFESLCCDVWATLLAQKRNCYKFANLKVMTHLHPSYGTAKNDHIYVKNLQSLQRDKLTLAELKKTL